MRLGTPAGTTRGFGTAEFREVGQLIAKVVDGLSANDSRLETVEAEVREAVDFLRYYANEAERVMHPIALPGPTGESNELRLTARGPWVCISPWNFTLAIFMGQVAAALSTGNTVLAVGVCEGGDVELGSVRSLAQTDLVVPELKKPVHETARG